MPRSTFMPEMTNLEVRNYLERDSRMVIVPVGSTEDHGDHGPLWTDVYIPLEVAKRAAPELEALVGPPIPFGIAHDHRGAHGLIHVRMDTFMDLVRDFTPELPELRTNPLALLDPLFLATPGSFWSLLEDGGGVWGKPSESTPEKGKEFLGWATRAV